ncbi:MAG: hypothetical protein JNM29_06160 [Candidatus Odyssella sp.]|nr:hypothetical protein [Candidatus Odyssella sp.]
MDEDVAALALVFAIWALLAAAYALVPMLSMPDAARVWGAGAAVFLALAVWVARSRRRR